MRSSSVHAYGSIRLHGTADDDAAVGIARSDDIAHASVLQGHRRAGNRQPIGLEDEEGLLPLRNDERVADRIQRRSADWATTCGAPLCQSLRFALPARSRGRRCGRRTCARRARRRKSCLRDRSPLSAPAKKSSRARWRRRERTPTARAPPLPTMIRSSTSPRPSPSASSWPQWQTCRRRLG